MDVTRRSFGTIVAGAFGALFVPRAAIAGAAVETTPSHLAPGGLVARQQGRVARCPTFKSFTRKDGSTGFRHFMVLATDGRFIPVVSWGQVALDLHYDTQVHPGAMVQVVGSLMATDDHPHIQCSKHEVIST